MLQGRTYSGFQERPHEPAQRTQALTPGGDGFGRDRGFRLRGHIGACSIGPLRSPLRHPTAQSCRDRSRSPDARGWTSPRRSAPRWRTAWRGGECGPPAANHAAARPGARSACKPPRAVSKVCARSPGRCPRRPRTGSPDARNGTRNGSSRSCREINEVGAWVTHDGQHRRGALVGVSEKSDQLCRKVGNGGCTHRDLHIETHDIDVRRLRQRAQQKLRRDEKFARNAGAHPRRLRG